ncbi:6-hydroxynicotinate 3-monooxygenase [Daldinia childiae]|uniref:6-hydroxynicotinate 3-monooxygenase n=1 Tax=Daldinia childiae TaxID=326645 RepID=UPI001445E3B9|nr:6-hydroxynicotinate 3-monooxygenase [Daldinia childiae]KAF3064626.1 6-hydroxynicotinate 3-monooxygenase [Daldinia childiae]
MTINGIKKEPIKVIVIGAGLGGCACALALKHHGHDVVVYERLKAFRRLGDSLGLGENALKLLERWGGKSLYHKLTSIGNQAPDMQIRRWHDGKILAQQPLMDMAGYIGHRGDYHEAFIQAVKDAGIEIQMGREVVAYDEFKPSVIFADGTEDTADLIVGADGIKSRARELVLGFEDAPKSSGYSCYRAYFPGKHLREDPLCREFVDHDCVNIWIGEDTHLVQNTLRNGDEFNWIVTRKLSHEADMVIKESWFQEGNMDEVKKSLQDLDPRIRAATRCYEKLRFGRTRASQTNGEDLRDRWHNALKNVDEGVEIDPETVKMRNRWLYAFDAEADTMERWDEVSALVSDELKAGKITPLC